MESEVHKLAMKVTNYESRTTKLEAKLKSLATRERMKTLAILCLVMLILVFCIAIVPTNRYRQMCIGSVKVVDIDEY